MTIFRSLFNFQLKSSPEKAFDRMRKIRFEMNSDEKKFPKSILNKNQTTQLEDETREEVKTLPRIKRDQSEKKEPTAGILRVDCSKPRRSSGESVDFGEMPNRLTTQGEPSSPQPSIDRLSVTFAEKSDWSESSVKINIFDPGSPPSQVREMEKIRFVGSPPDKDRGEEAEDDYSASVSVIIQRRESMKRASSRRKKRRTSSPLPDLDGSFHDSRRRSSEYTNSSGDTAISIDNETTQEQIFENIRLHKEVLSSVKLQPWGMRRKIKLVQQAKAYVKRHEGELQERLAMSKSTKDILARFNIWLIKELRFLKRELANTMTLLIPWELRIKEIESHFGSAVASYFTFLRWMFWVNLVITIVLACFVAIPEMLTADWKTAGERKEMLPEEKLTATNLVTLWDFGGVLKYSPIFYGYYTNHDGTGTGYRLPFAYFLTGLAVYVYSFVATLRRMAENSRMSKLSEKDDECVFTWKIFTGWDYMIGNAETAHNRVASLILGFKEVLLEETERKKDEKNWKVICLRVLVSFIVIGLLAFSAYIVFVVVERSTQPEANDSWWRQNEITVSVSIISLLFPLCFELLGLLEGYHPRKSLRIQLARIMVLNLLNLYTLIFSQFWKISDMTIELQSLKTNYSSQYFQNMPTVVSEPSPPICFLVPVNCTAASSSESSAPIFSTTTPISYQNITTATDFSSNITFTSFGLDNVTTLMTNFLYSDRFYNLTDFFTNGTFNVTLLETYLTRSTSSDFSSFSPETSTTSDEGGSTTLSDTLFSSTVFSLPIQFMTNLSSSTAEVSSTLSSGEEFSNLADESWNKTDFVTDLTQNLKKFDQRMTVTEAVDVTSESSTSRICLVKKCKEKLTNEKNVHSLYDMETRKRLRTLCWETMFGQELVKLTVMDLILTILSVLLLDFFRAIFVRVMNNCWCWDLEKKFPQYGDFKIAENILHLVYNQGMVWMGMFFSPGLPAINLIKLAIMMYLRSWAVLTCNVPHEVVFRASRSNNFYLALLLTMLFLCVLPVGYAIVWIEPSWHCGPFSDYKRIYHLFTKTLQKALPKTLHKALDYIASPGIIIPLLMLLVLIIYYLVSLTNSLREANNDLKIQLRRERTEERRKMFQMVNKRVRKESKESEIPFAKWRKLLPELAAKQLALANDVEKGEKTEGRSEGLVAVEPATIDAECKKEINRKEILARLMRKALKKSSAPTEENEESGEKSASPSREEKCPKSISPGKRGEEMKADAGKSETGPKVHTTGKKSGPRFGENDAEGWKKDKEKYAPLVGVVSRTISQPENIPVIKISKTESDEQLLTDNIAAGRGKSKFIWAVEQVIGMIRNEKGNSNGKDSILEKESQSTGNKTKSKKENENDEEIVSDFEGTVVNNYRYPRWPWPKSFLPSLTGNKNKSK